MCGSPQASLSMGFRRQKYWSGLPFSSPGDLSNSDIKTISPALAGGLFITEPLEKYIFLFTEFRETGSGAIVTKIGICKNRKSVCYLGISSFI